MAQDTPLPTGPGPWTVLHLVPFASLDSDTRVNLTVCERNRPAPLYGFDPVMRYNFDGLLIYHPSIAPDPCPTYLHLFHSGVLEAVEARMLGYHGNKLIPIAGWEQEMIGKVGAYLRLHRDLGVSPPVNVLLSLVNVKDYRVPHGAFAFTQTPIDSDDLLLPELRVDDLSRDPADILRPAFDAVWQAAGWPGCKNYDEEGKWVNQSRALGW